MASELNLATASAQAERQLDLLSRDGGSNEDAPFNQR